MGVKPLGIKATNISKRANTDPSSSGGRRTERLDLYMIDCTPARILAKGANWAHEPLQLKLNFMYRRIEQFHEEILIEENEIEKHYLTQEANKP